MRLFLPVPPVMLVREPKRNPLRHTLKRTATLASCVSLILLIPAVTTQPVYAQVETQVNQVNQPQQPQIAMPPSPARSLQHFLKNLRYDTAEHAPLIVVDPTQAFVAQPPLPEDRPVSLLTLAEAAHLRIVSAGHLNALVPSTLWRITAKPGKANPFAGMKRGELVKLLLASLTAAQWETIGSENGIGIGDLDEDQRDLWTSILPKKMTVGKRTAIAGDTPDSIKYSYATVEEFTNMESVRIRISKEATFSLSKTGANDYTYGGSPYFNSDKVGETKYTAGLGDDGTAQTRDSRSIYGVDLVTESTNMEKAGDVDYAAGSLAPIISLHFEPKVQPTVAQPVPQSASEWKGYPPNLDENDSASSLPTVGDLIGRVNAATQLHFVADRRVRDLPVFVRGDLARSGDLLRALARSVCGTFRKLPPSTPGEPVLYLLTADREGIGTQVMRLAYWERDAETAKWDAESKMNAETAKQNPLSHLHFAPDDRFALPQAQADAAEDGWRKQEYASAPEIKWSDLTPGLQEGVLKYQENASASLRTDRIRVGETLIAYLVVPGVGAIRDGSYQLSQNIGNQYAEEIAYDPSLAPNSSVAKPSAPATTSTAFVWPAKETRRVLVAAPATTDEVVALARSAQARGFTELWLEVSLADPAASAKLLKAGVKAGSALDLAVGASVELLKGSGMPGEPDRDILGQTGAEFGMQAAAYSLKRYDLVAHPGWKLFFARESAHYADWMTPPDPSALSDRLLPIAQVPGLCALTLRNTVAPGWAGYQDDVFGIWNNGDLGYTLQTRRAFLDVYGIDPIDIVNANGVFRQMNWNLGFFRLTDGGGENAMVEISDAKGTHFETRLRPASEVPRLAWLEFRAKSNRSLLATLYANLRKDSPILPLFLDDRLTPYALTDHSWFGSWDAADRLTENPPARRTNEVLAAARRQSKTTIAAWGGDSWRRWAGTPDDTPIYFAGHLGIVTKDNLPPVWDGIAVDVPFLPVTDVLRLLTGLPQTR